MNMPSLNQMIQLKKKQEQNSKVCIGMNTEKDEIFIQVKGIGFTFLLDKNLDKVAILGRESLSYITKTVMKQK